MWLHSNHQKSESRCLILVSSTSISKMNITTPCLVSHSVAVLKLDGLSSLLALVEFISHHTSVPQCDCPKLDWLSSLLVLVELIPHHTSVPQCGCPKSVLVEHHPLHLSDNELLTDSCTPHLEKEECYLRRLGQSLF